MENLIQKFMEHFELILTIAVIICLLFYIYDGFTYRKQRQVLWKAFKNGAETPEQRAAYRERLEQVPTIPAEAVHSPNKLMNFINKLRYRKAIAAHPKKLGILKKLDEGQKLDKNELFWLKTPVYSAESFVEFFSGIFWILFAVWFVRSFLYEPFRIPSGSMEPTLYAGDFILTNKFSYGVKLPVIHKTIIPVGEVKRGDVIVFRYPLDERLNYIKRVIGLPGDKVRFEAGKVWINDQLQPWSEPTISEKQAAKVQLTENLQDHSHKIQIYPYYRRIKSGTVIVPKNRYFVMGDNRDDSEDSRFWGFVPAENIVGKANLIWMNSNCIFGKGDCNHIGKAID